MRSFPGRKASPRRPPSTRGKATLCEATELSPWSLVLGLCGSRLGVSHQHPLLASGKAGCLVPRTKGVVHLRSLRSSRARGEAAGRRGGHSSGQRPHPPWRPRPRALPPEFGTAGVGKNHSGFLVVWAGRGGGRFTASGVPRETFGSWDLAFPPDLEPAPPPFTFTGENHEPCTTWTRAVLPAPQLGASLNFGGGPQRGGGERAV